ncbi:MAG: flagellar assembly protein FliW [Bryobacteraceae bacterium]|jgi:flagellar assembly factor FliW
MPTIETKYFGTMPCGEESCFDFPSGIPAFEDERRFLRLEDPAYHPLLFLQSTTTPALCFIAMEALAADPDYKLSVIPEDLAALDLPAGRQPRIGSEVLVLALLSIRENAPATANLLAPIVINVATRQALQAIRHDNLYSYEQSVAALTPLTRRKPEECPC